jgi:hypothetical protein
LLHQESKTWLPSHGVITEKDRKPMLAMFGAIVFYDVDGVLNSKIVEEVW